MQLLACTKTGIKWRRSLKKQETRWKYSSNYGKKLEDIYDSLFQM
jgi:hypothetical protein